ncbi:MAG: hypothetical protein N3B13_11060, partial [Deltaproteobacteria bacterium]|nr:hypothetical protein [Deltaproteobacteria bacterium]
LFLSHIEQCSTCKSKYNEYTEAEDILVRLNADKQIDDSGAEKIFSKIYELNHKKRFHFRLIAASALISVLLLVSVFYSNITFSNKLKEAREKEVSVAYFVDVEEVFINADEETFEVLSAVMYGDEYRDFEEILEETSIIKP